MVSIFSECLLFLALEKVQMLKFTPCQIPTSWWKISSRIFCSTNLLMLFGKPWWLLVQRYIKLIQFFDKNSFSGCSIGRTWYSFLMIIIPSFAFENFSLIWLVKFRFSSRYTLKCFWQGLQTMFQQYCWKLLDDNLPFYIYKII